MIGYTAGRDLKRMPSEIYWGGLGTWGIRRLDLSIAEYGQRASALGRLRPERDDDGNPTKPAASMWAAVPPPPENFLHGEITFELRPDEAQVLADCIRQRHPNTLLAVLCGMPGVPVDVDYPWDLPTPGLPDRLVEAADDIAGKVAEVLELRTSSYRVDIPSRQCDGHDIEFQPHRMRTRFAVAFGHQTLDEGGEVRIESVSRAFNSPFWPFVLTSTSIGQEGLDFHLWCPRRRPLEPAFQPG